MLIQTLTTTKAQSWHWLKGWVGCICLPFFLLVSPVRAQASPCNAIYKAARRKRVPREKRKWLQQAARCFYTSFRQRKSREERGRALWNAILMLRKSLTVARASKQPLQADVIRQQMLSWCRQYQRARLAQEDREKAKEVRRLLRGLTKELGYASLDIFTGSPTAKVCFQNQTLSRKQECQTTRWLSKKKLLAGTHRLEVTYNDVTQRRTIVLKRFKKQIEYFTPPFSSLVVVTNAAKAQITVKHQRGESRTTRGARKTFDGLIVGRYTVTVKYRHAASESRQVRVVLGKPTVATFQPPKPVAVNLRSTPPGARILIDGVPRGKTPLLSIPLAVGTHNIRLSKPCFVPLTHTLTIKPGASSDRPTLRLTRDPIWVARQKLKRSWQEQQKARNNIKLGLLIGGGTLIAAGGVLLSLGMVDNLNRLEEQKQDHALYTAKFFGEGQTGTQLNLAGVLVGGVGLGALLPGLWLQFTQAPPVAKLPCQIPQPTPKP